LPTNLLTNPWLGINPGRLRHRIEIQISVDTNDSFGQPIPAWAVLFGNVKAFVEPLSGQELFDARQLHAEVTHRIIVRYLAGITPKHRIVFGVRVFDILSPINLEERGLFLEIMTKERL
jgi:SPP1 family predicted phage head-tail adaptor